MVKIFHIRHFNRSFVSYPPIHFLLYFQLPICLAVKTGVKSGRSFIEDTVSVSGGYSLLFPEQDFEAMTPNCYPLVLGYNGRDHYFPTRPCTSQEYTNWKLNSQLGGLLAGASLVLEEVDTKATHLSRDVVNAIGQLTKTLNATFPVIAPKKYLSYLKKRKELPAGGPSFAQEPGSQVPVAPAGSSSSSAPSAPSGSTSSKPQPAKKKGGRKLYMCHMCGVTRTRSNDLAGHMFNAHGVGDPLVCTFAECKGKKFATKSSLKTHLMSHSGKWRHPCPKKGCDYGTHNKSLLNSHLVTQHQKGGGKCRFKCKLCHQKFAGRHLLSKHLHRGLCTLSKNIPCPHDGCKYKFKTTVGRDNHFHNFHGVEGGSNLECATCGVVVKTKKGMAYHQKQHRANALIKQYHDQRVARKAYRATQRAKVRPTKSTPAKLKLLPKSPPK